MNLSADRFKKNTEVPLSLTFLRESGTLATYLKNQIDAKLAFGGLLAMLERL